MRELVAGHKTAALALAGFEASGEEMELAKFLTEVYWAQDRGASVGSLCFLLGTFVFFRHQQDETKVIGHVGFTEKYCGLVRLRRMTF